MESSKKALKYLQGTKTLGLGFIKENDQEGFADADWTSNNDRNSYTGYVFKLSGSAVSWESNKKTVALSSKEAKYMALTEASKEAIYLRNLFKELYARIDSSDAPSPSTQTLSSDLSRNFLICIYVFPNAGNCKPTKNTKSA